MWYDKPGISLTHPMFRDVYFVLHKKFFIKEKNAWKLKVTWRDKKGNFLATETLLVKDKLREFKKRDQPTKQV